MWFLWYPFNIISKWRFANVHLSIKYTKHVCSMPFLPIRSNVFDECIEMLVINHLEFDDIFLYFLYFFYFFVSSNKWADHFTHNLILDPFGVCFRMFEHYFYHSNIGLDVRQNSKESKPEHRTRMHKKWNKVKFIEMTNGGHGNRSTEILSTWKKNETDPLNKNVMDLFTNHCHFVPRIWLIVFLQIDKLIVRFGFRVSDF